MCAHLTEHDTAYFLAMSSPNWAPDEALLMASEAAAAKARNCPKCGALAGDWCTAYATMHFERWGYGSL